MRPPGRVTYARTPGPTCRRLDTALDAGRADRRGSRLQRVTPSLKSSSTGPNHPFGAGRRAPPVAGSEAPAPARGDRCARPARRPRPPRDAVRGIPADRAARADEVALRTPGDVTIDLARVRERVRRIAAGLPRSASAAATPSASCSPTVPSSTRRHRRAAPGRGAVLDLQHQFPRADRLPLRQRGEPGGGHRAGVPRGRTGGGHRRSSTSSAWTRPATGAITLAELEANPKPDFDFDAAWQAVETGGPRDADLHLRHHRPAEGRGDHAPQPGRGGGGARPVVRADFEATGSPPTSPAAHIADRVSRSTRST